MEITIANGTVKYTLNGKLHREDERALECVSGEKQWYLTGKRHREDGIAIGSLHCERQWYFSANLRSEDIPIIEPSDPQYCELRVFGDYMHGSRLL